VFHLSLTWIRTGEAWDVVAGGYEFVITNDATTLFLNFSSAVAVSSAILRASGTSEPSLQATRKISRATSLFNRSGRTITLLFSILMSRQVPGFLVEKRPVLDVTSDIVGRRVCRLSLCKSRMPFGSRISREIST